MTATDETGALAGLRVLNLSGNLIGAFVGQFFADYGAEVVLVEPEGGSPLRRQAGWPLWSRGSKSIVAGLDDPGVRRLALRSDVLIDTFRPGVLDRHGLGHAELSRQNPRLVTTSVTGFPRDSELGGMKGYEGVVMAKIGGYSQFATLGSRPGPAFAAMPYCTASAAEVAFIGAMAALYERETSGLGQHATTSLMQAVGTHDTWNWMTAFMARKYPDAFQAVPVYDGIRRVPNGFVSYGLLVGLAKDGKWLQFSQSNPKLFQAFLRVTGLDDPKWDHAWESDSIETREAFWEHLLIAVRQRTVAEWQQTFDEHPNVFAEIFRSSSELLDHPQLQHDGQIISVDRPEIGLVRMPGVFANLSATPGDPFQPSPTLDQHGAALRAKVAGDPPVSAPDASVTTAPPLEGVTILDIGSFFAAPGGLVLLGDLGADVVKVEPPEGDNLRFQNPFPHLGSVKAMQSKRSIIVDLGKAEGVELVKRLSRDADLVMQNFRGGVAARMGVDEASMRAVNPDIIYHAAPGFGTDGPYARRPAYAPTIGAAAGLARRNLRSAVPEGADLTLAQVKDGALRMGAATMTMAHADGFSALGVACAELIALYAKKRGRGGQGILTTMLATMAQILSEDLLDYDGHPEMMLADDQLYGFGPLYRLYETASGWVFLAAPEEKEWAALRDALPDASLDDERFVTAAGRGEAADQLADRLAMLFRTRTAAEWEAGLAPLDIACVEVETRPSHEALLMPGMLGDRLGITMTVDHPLFGEHPRLKSVVSLSRSGTREGPAAMLGEHTIEILEQFGFDEAERAGLLERRIVALD